MYVCEGNSAVRPRHQGLRPISGRQHSTLRCKITIFF